MPSYKKSFKGDKMDNNYRLIRRNDVEHITGLKRSSLYAKMAEGCFPKPIKLGSRTVAWLAADVQAWINEKISESRGK
jgi:prophage regulatory protein